MRLRAVTLVLLVVLLAAVPAGAAPPSRAAAKRALAKVQQLQHGKGVRTGRELTPALAELFASLPSLSRDDRRVAEGILARPDDGVQDPSGTHKWLPHLEAANSPKCSAHFCVHFTGSGPDASDATYAQSMVDLFENQVYPCENGTAPAGCALAGQPGLGWRDPAPDGALGETGATRCTQPSCLDIYIEDLFPDRIFGYVALDPSQDQNPSVPHHAYMVLDKDYSRFATPNLTGTQAEQVTAAHEYNHVLQNAYDFIEDPWMFEATAVYMEEKVYPAINDYLNYVNSWVANTGQPLTAFPDTNLKAYGSAVWNHWLDHRYGPAAVRSAWEQSVASGDFAPGAYNAAIAGAGGAGFMDEFDRFAATVAEWNAPGSGFPDHYPDVPRAATLAAGSTTNGFALPHTTFALFDVPITAAPTIRLTATLPAGTNGAVALVGRTGSDPNGGAVTSNVTPMPSGGTGAVSLDNPAQFGRITAVVANADPSQAGFSAQTQDWIFTKDANSVVLTLAEAGPPIASTSGASVGDRLATVNGSVAPRLLDTTSSFQYGTTTAYGASVASDAIPGSIDGSRVVAAQLTGLKPNTTYHYRIVATNSAGATPGADMTFTTLRDVTKPIVSFIVKRQKIRTVRTRGFVYLGRCNERCVGSARLTVTRRIARKLGTSTVLGKSRIKLDPKQVMTTLRVGLTKRTRKKLAKVKKAFPVTLKISVADESGNTVTVKRRVKLTR